ncbi:uncharacterized protein LOC111454013 [Cucurbita moschata]|uniref:Uncharacterized protein LOC111454013 n=1 Tax=Cucurbita moschata TaxID=3662 RepID=A0A6J1GHL7_CUCMO|nr:uncharacterized protein LOC111454013 [Cucurbita moschata]
MTSTGAAPASSPSEAECCMCGDFGFSDELFRCKICQFRSQHRYCSNLYPKADCYRICNWCLTQKEESKAKSPNSSNSSSLTTRDDHSSIKTPRNKDQIRTFLPLQTRPIKKQRSPEASERPQPPPPPPPRRKPIAVEDNLRRTRSEEISHRSGIQRPVIFRNKVRRYKLLDEVSS